MLKALWIKFKESALSVLPVALIVLLLNCTPIVNFTTTETVIFACSSLALILGISLFNLGADIAMTPMGEQIGSALPKAGRFKTLLLVCFLMGIFITVAEPDLSVLASQVKASAWLHCRYGCWMQLCSPYADTAEVRSPSP